MTLGPLQRRVQIEPLDDERVTNIERRLVVAVSSQPAVAPPARTRLSWATLATGALAAAVVALAAWTWHQHAARAAPAAPGVVADVAPQRTQVATDAGRSTITVDDAAIASDAGTAFAITHTGADRMIVELAHGRLDLAVKHEPGRTLIIRAGDTDIEDVGTAFTVAYDGAAVDLRVTEGEVKVTREHQVARVGAGDAWTSARGLVALAELPPLAPASLFAPLTPLAPLPPVAAKTPVIALAPRVAAVPVAPSSRPARVASVTNVSAPHAAPRDATALPAASRVPTSLDPYVELRTAIRAQPIAFDPKIDGKADAANEIAKLKLLAYSPTTVGGEASAALYRIAVLLARPLEQDAAALGTLELYFRRFSGGKERTAALWLRVRIACGHKIDEGCRSAAYAYQHEAPAGDAADVAVRITDAQ